MGSYRVGPGWAVACALILAGFPSSAANAQAYAAAEPPAAPSPTPARVRSLDDEVQLVAPGGPVMLAQEFELKLEGQTSALTRVSVTQWVEATGGNWREVYQGFQSGPVERRGDSVVLKIAPYQVGKVQLRVTGTGRAGDELEMLHKDLWIEVAAPAAGPSKLRFGQAGSPSDRDAWRDQQASVVTGRVSLTGSGRVSTLDLRVVALYDGVLAPQPVSTGEVHYRVRTGQRVVALDEQKGAVRGVKPGHALIEASYGGMITLACVVVEGDGRADPGCGDAVNQ